MTLPTGENPISFSQIRTEFGDGTNTSTSPVRLGQYRRDDSAFNNKNVGDLTNLPLDTGIPTSGTINVDSFHGKKLNVIVDYYSGSTEIRPDDARAKYQAASASGNRVVVGGYKDRVINDSSGSKVVIHVNKIIGSAKDAVTRCAVRTGTGWESGTDLSIEVGGSGKIFGAGGNGGNGCPAEGSLAGIDGDTGSSALGISYSGTVVNLKSGALIRRGYGGGGGGGGSNGIEEAGGQDSLFLEHLGSGGGGGAGLPGGTGGTPDLPKDGGTGTPNSGEDADSIDAGDGGAAGPDRNFGGEGGYAGGGKGGHGGDFQKSAENGNPGEAGGGEWQDGPSTGSGGEAGGNGAAIRKASGVTWTFGTNSGTVTGSGAGGSGESPTGVS